ncbi:uncharacterized protein LOC122136257 [Cyprinus carpio]|uniref:Uncharacterized protein LOC122136257 n=2 Tax=Cyprinus carpio TaxID=7962 RepID=A0A9Q9W0M8_CYPCA|nr:uncharacterized protein LOC122136257 [Cyprinus carpio]
MKSWMLGFYAVLLLWLLVLFSSQGGCLTTTDTKVPLKNLLSYTIQSKPLFSVDAARFLTIKRKIICSDPSSSRAKKAMSYLDEKNKKLQSVSNKTAHHSVTGFKEYVNHKYNISSELYKPICTPPVENSQKIEIRGHTTHKTEIPRIKPLEQDWRGSSETTETVQLDGPKWEEGGETESLLMSSTIMHEPYIISGYFCLREKFKYLGS